VKLKGVEKVKKNLPYLRKRFEEISPIFRVKDPNIWWAFYYALEHDFRLSREEAEKLYKKLVKLGFMTEEEGKKAIYHLFDAVFREYRDYGGFLFNVAEDCVKKKQDAFINTEVLLDVTFKVILGEPAIALSKLLGSL